jgi:hypothetical protein
MDTVDATAAAVMGARHRRTARNGQDAAVASCDGGVAVVVACDGCSTGTSSEVGAQLGSTWFARSLATRLQAGARVTCDETWAAVRADVVRALAELLERMPGDRAQAIHDHFLFTIVAAAATRDGAAVWALGDGAYWFGGSTRVLGPFADNAPPYLAYELLGDPQPAHFVELAPCEAIVIATDGASEIDGLERFAANRYLDHPDALRRELALLARSHERIDWDERRVVRTPAVLQDDCAIGVVRWRKS